VFGSRIWEVIGEPRVCSSGGHGSIILTEEQASQHSVSCYLIKSGGDK